MLIERYWNKVDFQLIKIGFLRLKYLPGCLPLVRENSLAFKEFVKDKSIKHTT